jgi:hypothetical protein
MFKVKAIGVKADENGNIPEYIVYDIHLDRSKTFNDQQYVEFLMYRIPPQGGKLGWDYYLADYFEPV